MTVHFFSVIITIVFKFICFLSCLCFCQALFLSIYLSVHVIYVCSKIHAAWMISIWISSYVIHQRAHPTSQPTGWWDRCACKCKRDEKTDRHREIEWSGRKSVVTNQKTSNKSGLEKHVFTIVLCRIFNWWFTVNSRLAQQCCERVCD